MNSFGKLQMLFPPTEQTSKKNNSNKKVKVVSQESKVAETD